MNNIQSRPLVGILSAQNKDGSLAGNIPLFKKIQKKLISLHGISFIFTLEGVHHDWIEGFIYSPDHNKWNKASFPYPDVIYNRIPFRTTEQSELCRIFFSSLKDRKIPYFNPGFIDKYKFYQLMGNHPKIKKYLPDTIPIQEKTEFFSFLNKHKNIYLKPAQSSKGSGIYRLKTSTSNQLLLEGRTTQKTYLTFQHFWDVWEQTLIDKNYLAQMDIHSAEYEGKRFDFRILVHADPLDYSLTGVGIRQSQRQDITTHTISGGRIVPYPLLQSEEHDQFIQSIISPIGNTLSKEFGFFGEFSIDAGISKDGRYYIFEVNSKPMSFDEPEIEEKKIERLCHLFYHIPNFT